MVSDLERQSIVDGEHLKLLSIGYWVWGGIMAVYSVFIGAYFGLIGFIFLSVPDGADAPPDFFRWFFPTIGLAAFLVAGSIAGLMIANGFWIRRRRHRVFSMVIAGFTCASVPVGTMLGVFTFLVLGRPTVRALYEQEGSPQSAEPARTEEVAESALDGPPT